MSAPDPKSLPLRKDDYKDAFSTAAGKRVLLHLKQLYFGESYIKGETERDMAYREGRRAVVIFIERKIEQGNAIPDKETENA